MILMLLSLERFASDPATGAPSDGIYELGTGTLSAQRIGAGDDASGAYSYATGRNNTASGDFASALGDTNQAIGDYSFAGGRDNVVQGEASTAFGEHNEVSGSHSFATGGDNIISGAFSGAIGHENTVVGINSVAIGGGHLLIGDGAFATGDANIILGIDSFAFGGSNEVVGNNAGAFGGNNIVSGNSAFAIGHSCEASGRYSSAHGNQSLSTSDSEQSYASDCFVLKGDAQERVFYLMLETLDGSPKAMAVGLTAAVPNLPVPSNGTWNVNVQLVGRYVSGAGGSPGDTIAINMRAAVDQTTGFVVILNPGPVYESFDGGSALALGYDAQLVASAGDIEVRCTGAADCVVRWFAIFRIAQLVIH